MRSDPEFVSRLNHLQVDAFSGVIAIAVDHRIYHGLAHRDSDLVLIFLVEADVLGDADHFCFRTIHTIQRRFQPFVDALNLAWTLRRHEGL